MLYRHVFDKISTEFRGPLRVFVNFAALRRREISMSFTFYKLATKNLHLATIFLQLVAKRRPENFSNFEPWFQAGYTWAPTLPKDLESRCRSNQPTSIELSLSYPLAFPPLTVKMQCLHCLLQRWATVLLTRQSCCGSF